LLPDQRPQPAPHPFFEYAQHRRVLAESETDFGKPGPRRFRSARIIACRINRSAAGMPGFRVPPAGFGISTRFTGLRVELPPKQRLSDLWPVFSSRRKIILLC